MGEVIVMSCSKIYPLLAFLLFCTGGCGKDYSFNPSIEQGMWGRVEFREGNFMPGPVPPSGTVTFVQRRIYVFEITHSDDVVQDTTLGPVFYTEIRKGLVAKTLSNSHGYFQLSLPLGSYSLFVEEQGRYYANLFDGQGYIFPVTVTDGSIKRIDILIDYKAFY